MDNAILLRKNTACRMEATNADGVAIMPGQLVEFMGGTRDTGFTARRDGHSGVDYRGAVIAVEDELQGRGINDAYAVGDLMQIEVLMPGDRVQVFLSPGNSTAVGSTLHTDGAGNVIVAANGAFVALEALTIATGGSATLINALYLG